MSDSETQKTQGTDGESTPLKLTTALLVTAIIVCVVSSFYSVIQFASHSMESTRIEKLQTSFAAPGKITVSIPESSRPSIVVDSEARRAIDEVVAELPIARSLFAQNATDASEDARSVVQSLISTIESNELTMSERRRRLEHLAKMPTSIDTIPLVNAFLESAYKNHKRYPSDVLAQIAKQWISRTNSYLSRRIEQLNQRQIANRYTKKTLQKGRVGGMLLTPEPMPIVRPDINRNSAMNRNSTVNSSSNRSSSAGGSLNSNNNQRKVSAVAQPAKETSFATVMSELKNPATAVRRAKSISKRNDDDPFRMRVISDARIEVRALIERDETKFVRMPQWIDCIASEAKDAALLELIRGYVLRATDLKVDSDQVHRAIQLAIAGGTPAWAEALLDSINPAPIGTSESVQQRVMTSAGWPSAMASAVDHLCRDDSQVLYDRMGQRTLAGMISREALMSRGAWSEGTVKTIVDYVERALSDASDSDDARRQLAWIGTANLDEPTRKLVTDHWAKIQDTDVKLDAWATLLPVLDPYRDAATMKSAMERSGGGQHSRRILLTILNHQVAPKWDLIAAASVSIDSANNFDPSSEEAGLLRHIDARIASFLLQDTGKKGQFFELIAKRFGGRSTAGILKTEFGISSASKSGLSDSQTNDIVEAISKRSRDEHED